MMSALYRAYATFRGFDLTGSSVPPMDGPLRPNTRLDEAPVALTIADVDNLAAADGPDARLLASVGSELVVLAPSGTGDGLVIGDRTDLGRPITAMASGPGGALAVAVEGGIMVERRGEPRRQLPAAVPGACVTAMAFAGPDTLVATVGSAAHPAAEWKRDLMTKGATGSVWRILLADGTAAKIADGLSFPCGIAVAGKRVFVSEAWRHRILRLDLDGGAPAVAVAALPAYPGRIAPARSGGFWVALFAPRNPLVEFVLGEDAYRRRMVETIDPDHWIAPSLLAGRSFLEPIQGGTRKKLNMLKPWSPTWSGGLVARCDGDMQVLASFHSRADGHVHGVTSLAELGGRLYAGAKGAGKIVTIEDKTELRAR
ncbi:hypothetical protein [Labrys wisconsinensis]|uniref:Strictosidine synthase n=1 Tax=Labrys wisconsinensis TaxID=425677 RepID=A0ABU0JG26_9HYPH|nr:hypothetical protein [Labrys wisconsinensis]MDQ0473238.1 hypothetical protein [Labrys wisconsinensis]